jgi:serine/threonine-protein kinase RsbW
MPNLHSTLTSELEEIGRLAEIIEAWAEDLDLPMKTVMETNLMLDELITNVISYGYRSEPGHPIDVSISIEGALMTIRLADKAPAFDPLQSETPDVTADIDDRDIGGLGIHFVRKLSQSMHYSRVDEQNVVVLEKTIPGR